VEPDFDIFDPFHSRHSVISHHYAHAVGTFDCSGFENAAVLVCDVGGSSTLDGRDFCLPFYIFQRRVSLQRTPQSVVTETVSIYDAVSTEIQLKHREYGVPHNNPDVFVCNAASLYDNVSRAIFRKENAHGQLMALASIGGPRQAGRSHSGAKIIDELPDGRFCVRNDWQHLFVPNQNALDYGPLALEVQLAFEELLIHQAMIARDITQRNSLAVAGGAFLNIVANSRIAASGLFEEFFVPSAPHDAGISIGCAFSGWRMLHRGKRAISPRSVVSDRLGPIYDDRAVKAALASRAPLVTVDEVPTASVLAERLREGDVIARFQGRSEFGPRALGGRSLLASPLLASSKSRLNKAKGRQGWRPVAPVIPIHRIGEFFEGPDQSPFMNFVHTIKMSYRNALQALSHPDGSTRAQTLSMNEDPYLFELLLKFGEMTGFPILCNTSLNGPGEPIIETPGEAIDFFLSHAELDKLILNNYVVSRKAPHALNCVLLPSDAIVTVIFPSDEPCVILVRRRSSMMISQPMLSWLCLNCKALRSELGVSTKEAEWGVAEEVFRAVCLGLMSMKVS
jgi:carbamoyltransferase